MGPLDRMPSLRPLLAATAAALILGGCSSEPEPLKVPQGHVEYRGDVYAFAHPRGWTESRAADERGAPVVTLHGAKGPHGSVLGQVLLSRRDRYGGTLGDQIGQARALTRISGRRIVADRKQRVPGAERGHRIETVYDEPSPEGVTVRFRSIDVYALTKRGTLLELVVRAAEDDFARLGLARIADSLRVTA